MKYIKLKYSFLSCRICFLLLIIFLFLAAGEAFAEEKKKKKSKNLNIGFTLATTYDNNILKYSDKYLARFMNGQDEGRFHIDTYDDIILYTSLKMSYTFRIFGKLRSIINGEVSRRTYVVNDIKSWNYMTFGYLQYITKRASFKILYSYIPSFYVRHFRDWQWVEVYGYTPETFKPYVFSKDNFGFYIQNTFFKNTRVKLSLYHARYYHNKYYTEYDSKDWIYGIKLYQPLHKKFRLEASYQFVTSDAKGYNSAIETPETSNGPDATFVEDRFVLGFLWYLPRIAKHSNNLDVDFILLLRYYSSKYPPLVDPLHAGRYDKNYRITASYNFTLSKSFKLSVFYRLYLRDSDTKARINRTYVSNEKDYSQYHLGLSVAYKIKL